MNSLKVQKFLKDSDPRSALGKLVDLYGIEVNETEDLAQLTYSMISSPRGNDLVDECRGLILQKLTWNVVAMPFYRFYNFHEGPAAKPKLSTSMLWEKLDGSLLILYHWNNEWHVATRGRLNADGPVGDSNMTFAELFWETVSEYHPVLSQACSLNTLDTNMTFVFELCSPENRVVTPYKERFLRLLTARNRETLEEASLEELEGWSQRLDVPTPKINWFKDDDHINNMISAMPPLDEGFVLCDYGQKVNGSYARIKIKNPAYFAASALIGKNFNSAKALELIIAGKDDDFCALFPEHADDVKLLRDKFNWMAKSLDATFEQDKHLAEISRKDFAMKASKSKFSAVLFGMLDGHHATALDGLKKVKPEKLVEVFDRNAQT